MPLVSISQYPMDFGENHIICEERSVLTMFKQIVIGLKELCTDFVFMLEHDVLYHPSHFDFTPPKNDIYYFNTNVWSLETKTGKAIHYDGMRKTSGLVANRELLLQHYIKKIERVKKEGRFSHRLGYEPGKSIDRGGVDNYDRDDFESDIPNVDIKNGMTLTKLRMNLNQYSCKKTIQDSWITTTEIPYWGKTKPFHAFLRRWY